MQDTTARMIVCDLRAPHSPSAAYSFAVCVDCDYVADCGILESGTWNALAGRRDLPARCSIGLWRPDLFTAYLLAASDTTPA
jgi:hypothetical protein